MMIPEATRNRTRDLQQALRAGRVPTKLVGAAETLLAHLSRPAQITVLGPKGSGKTTLLNLILGETAMPDTKCVNIVELSYGEDTCFAVDAGDGETHRQRGCATPEATPVGAFCLVQEMPLDRLQHVQLCEINLPSHPGRRDAILDWAAEGSDVVIWCTQVFNSQEVAIWADMSDALKDRSFLVVAKADEMHANGTLVQQIERFERHYSGEFLGLYPIAAKQAISAPVKGSVSHDSLWTSSGAKALIDRIERQIHTGKAADLDHAEMLLSKCDTPDASPIGNGARPPNKTKEGAKQTNYSLAPNNMIADISVIQAAKRNDTVNGALAILQSCSRELDFDADTSEEARTAILLTQSGLAATKLKAFLDDKGPDSGQLATIRKEAVDCEKRVQDLQRDGTQTAAYTAISALLQVKKSLSEVAYG